MDILTQIVIFSGAAFCAVVLSKRLGLDATLGYLVAGLLLGPVFNVIEDSAQILEVAELGVVLLLFVLGLEIQPHRLWSMRHTVFGLGAAQLALTSLILGGALALMGLPWLLAGLLGLMLTASSTPMALQILRDRRELSTRHGRTAFSIVLFQDLMAIPLFAAIPLLGREAMPSNLTDLVGDLAVPVAIVAGFSIAGRFVLHQVLRFVAQVNQQDAFTATTLFTVAVSAWLMDLAGLSPALGAFLGGLLLADSAYRHELEANVEPFKGLLLSLLFIAVGLSINIDTFLDHPIAIPALVIGLVGVKAGILYLLGRLWTLPSRGALTIALAMSQGGEFAFALLILARSNGLLDQGSLDLATLVVGLSMASTPVLMRLLDVGLSRRDRGRTKEPEYDRPDADGPIIIAGFGRVGQISARILRARGESFVALEPNLDQVELARRFGNRVYFGDPARLDLLRQAGIEKARLFIIALEDMDHALKVATIVRAHFPQVPIYSRARNRLHVHKLMDLGVEVIERDTFHSALELANKVMAGIGYAPEDAARIVELFRQHDENHLRASHASYTDEKALVQRSLRQAELLAEVLADDARMR